MRTLIEKLSNRGNKISAKVWFKASCPKIHKIEFTKIDNEYYYNARLILQLNIFQTVKNKTGQIKTTCNSQEEPGCRKQLTSSDQ